MTVGQVVFYVVAALTVGAAFFVVLARNIVHCAIALVFTFFGVAGLYILLDSEFLAAVQVLLYVGGITILLLFAIMLTGRIADRRVRIMNEQVGGSALVAVAIFSLVTFAILRGVAVVDAPPPGGYFTAAIGRLLMTTYVLPFEAASILLLVAMVGAIILARREQEKD